MEEGFDRRGRIRSRTALVAALAIAASLAFAGCVNQDEPDSSTQWQPMEGAEQDVQQTPKPTRPKEPRRTEIPHG